MHFVYQTRAAPIGKRKKGKMLDNIVIHVMDGEKTVCGFSPQATLEYAPGGVARIVDPGVRLIRASIDQIRAWLFSQAEGTGAFSASMCWSCADQTQMRLKYRGCDGISENVIEIFEALAGGNT
jgi:hypothetical protein